MRVIPPALLAHLQGDATSIAMCWLVQKTDGSFIRGTEHDQDVTMPSFSPDDLSIAGVYSSVAGVSGTDIKSSSDMSVDNMEVKGAFSLTPLVIDVSLADINAGVLNSAAVVVFACNWQNPGQGYFILLRGYLGQIAHTSDAGYTTEIRSLSQLLTQNLCQTYTENCNVLRFGDARCKFNVASTQVAGAVTGITDRRIFAVNLALGSPPPVWSYNGGLLLVTSGENESYTREVKYQPSSQVDGFLELWDALPADLAIGDTFTMTAGCDRTLQMCTGIWGNQLNFRGYGVYIPGVMALTQGPQ
jgi:uncharacterized phage protein (TIGR02218 family)